MKSTNRKILNTKPNNKSSRVKVNLNIDLKKDTFLKKKKLLLLNSGV